MKKTLLLAVAYFIIGNAFGQTILEEYIRYGIANNQSIKQQEFALEKSIYALQEAKTLFLPKVSLLTNYFAAAGGRTVDFPAGDLLNPVYNSLNQLTGSNNFPVLPNQNILLNPHNFYDARIRTAMPLLNPEIGYNRNIKQLQVSMQQLEIDAYQRALAKEIKVAYYGYLQSLEAEKIYDYALALVLENKRVNESLFRNDRVNRTAVLRAQQEVNRVESLKQSASESTLSAKAYFNFLLNRDLAEEIAVDTAYQEIAFLNQSMADVSNREELAKLKTAQAINNNMLSLTKAKNSPKINAFLDLGSQGFDWQVDSKTRYFFFGLALEWDLFQFGNNRHSIKQVEKESKILDSQVDYVQRQLQLALSTAYNQYNIAVFQHASFQSVKQASEKNYHDFLKLYKEGQALYVEFLDAQNQYIESDLQLNVSLFDTYIKAAEIESIIAGYNINQTK